LGAKASGGVAILAKWADDASSRAEVAHVDAYARAVALGLFAGIRVGDYDAARPWYERLLGRAPTFVAHATEAVWELAAHRYLFIEQDREAPGGSDDHDPRR
jgi:hypothetical protein